jgi:MYXO-CTERM domain-containing protein
MTKRQRISLGVVALIALGAAPARAARLVEIDRQQQDVKSPETATLDPCLGTAFGTVTIGGDGRTEVIDQNLNATGRGTIPSCAVSSTVDFDDTATFMIEPDLGESMGDPVTLCTEVRGTASAQSQGTATARSQMGASTLSDPAFISVNAVNQLTLGPFDVTAGVDHGEGRKNVAAAIGDTVVLQLHAVVNATVNGVGRATASSDAKFLASVGACATSPAPAASPAGLAALLAALGAGGVWTLRRRRWR